MEKVMSKRLAMAAAVVVCLLLATAAQEAAAGDYGEKKYITYPKPNAIHCKVLGNCEKQYGQGQVDPTRPGKPANQYTRGCSAINQCRG